MMGIPRCDGALVSASLAAVMSLGGAAMVAGARPNRPKKLSDSK